jgi:hypothetical protein
MHRKIMRYEPTVGKLAGDMFGFSSFHFQSSDLGFLGFNQIRDSIEFNCHVFPEVIATECTLGCVAITKLTQVATQASDRANESVTESDGVKHECREQSCHDDGKEGEFT